MERLTVKEVIKKIKSIEQWEWYFDPEVREYKDFYKFFKEKYAEIDLDFLTIKQMGIALIKGDKEIEMPQDVKETIQGNNVAFKCTYNDSGFNGRCSDKLCEYNWEQGGDWCKQEDNPCRNGEKYPCYESEIWKEYKFGAGVYHNGPKRGQSIPLRNVKVEKVAILTTNKPNANKEDRYIFGILDITEFDDGKSKDKQTKEAFVYGSKETSIIINPKFNLNFYDFYKNKNATNKDFEKFWGTGLFRYLSDEQVYAILCELKEKYLQNNISQKEIEKVKRLIERYKQWV